MKRRLLFLFAAISATALFDVVPAPAEFTHMSIRIDGLACPFCVYGIEKKLRAVDGVDEVSLDLETGIAELALAGGKTPTLSELRTAIEKAGFTAREVIATVIGIPFVEKRAVWLRVRNSAQTYFIFEHAAEVELERSSSKAKQMPSEELRTKLLSLADEAALVGLSGVLYRNSNGLVSLSIATIEKL